MDFRFTNEYPEGKIDEIVSYLTGPRLWIPAHSYPDFFNWAQRAHGELKKGIKRAMVAFSSGDVVGVAIYQRHKKHADALEIKNLTVRPEVRGRHIASFLLRNAEIEGIRDFKSKRIVCDVKAGNCGVMRFLLRHCYMIAAKTDLYGLSSGHDIVYVRNAASLGAVL